MANVCSECGEELIGNVNRCWRCGNMIVAAAEVVEQPDVMYEQNGTPDAVPVAYLIPEESDTPDPKHADLEAAGKDSADSATGGAPSIIRSGSPFRESGSQGDFQDVVMPKYPDNILRENLAVASVVVAIMSLVASIATAWSLIPSATGLGLGILGFKSERRRTAIAGIVLSCLAIFFGTWKTIDAVQTYYELYELQQMDRAMEY